MINKLEVTISNDPISGLKRKMQHVKFEIGEDLQMIHYRRIIFYEKLEGDVYGRPILQAIAENENLSDEQKKKLTAQYEPQIFHVTTNGSMVNQYGVEVAQNSDNTFPEGAVSELEWWQGLPISILGSPSKCSEVVYGALQMSMSQMDQQNRV
jgi:hypothetical protein